MGNYVVNRKKRNIYNNTDRNYGIDLLRIISMIMIVILHVISHGKVLDSSVEGSNQYFLIRFIDVLAYCAVNCYGLISGYLGYGKKFKLANLLYLWIEVLFYSITISFVFMLFYPNFGLRKFLTSFFPLILGRYWYFTAYFLMFFFMPLYNYLIEKLSKKNTTLLVGAIVLFSSVFPLLLHEDIINLSYGYSALWLSLLYILGAYIKKYNVLSSIKKRKWFLVYLCCAGVSFGYELVIKLSKFSFPTPFSYLTNSNLLIGYTSPTILFCGISLVLLFSKLNIRKALFKPVVIFSSATFGVYLIHDNYLCEVFIMPKLAGIADLSIPFIPFAIIGIALGIWLFASIIDIARNCLFQLVQIKRLSLYMDKIIMNLVKRLINRIVQ